VVASVCVIVVAAITWPRPAAAWGIGSVIEHAAGYAAGGVAAHETERYLDHRNSGGDRYAHPSTQPGDAPDIQHDGRLGLVFPEADAMPNPRLTPGALNPAVTQANIGETICRRGGYTKSIRPDEAYTERLKREQVRQYGYPQQMGKDAFMLRNMSCMSYHLVSLELGGSPTSPQNLWPEPHRVLGGWGSYVKDQLENRLHSMVCHHQITLAQAQGAIAHNWVEAYQAVISKTPKQARSHRYGG
jgi:hypothetical protein